MTTSTQNYGTPTAITLTFASLTNGSYRQSDVVDNSTNKFHDAIVGGKFVLGAVTTNAQVEFYAYASYDGTTFIGVPGTTDAAITWGTSTSVLGYQDIKFLGAASTEGTDDSDTVEFGPYSIREAFGQMPIKWGIICKNASGATLDGTQTGAELKYVGVKYDAA
jgi:hypothetical protein